jgi:sigma-B regulation protein RsbU (phosphoserine phosphatase)
VVFRRLADDTHRLVYISENLSQWGYSAADFLAGRLGFDNILHPDDQGRVVDEIEQCRLEEVEEYAQEYRIITAGGEVRWVSDETSVVTDEAGQRIYNQGVLVDITASKLAREALEASEFKFRRTIEGAAEGYLLMDADLVIREVNDAYCRMLGYEREELVGRRPHDFATLDYQRFLETNTDRLRGKTARRFEGTMVHRDGHVVPVLVNANTLLDAGGGFLGNVAFVADLTEQKKALNLAAEVQKGLLPRRAPRIPGLDVAGRSVPSELTGGDYFEPADPDRPVLSVAVGDISGHGVDAALLMTTARGFLRMRAGQSGSPSQIVSEMNRHLAEDLYGSGRFMTLFYLRLDAVGAQAAWVRAGHDPALIYCPVHDTFTELGADAGLPLGVERERSYNEEHGDVRPGQLIAIGTDGIWEARNAAGRMFGKERFKAVLREHAADTAREIVDAVFDAVREYSGGVKLEDDVTLVVIKCGVAS